MLTRSSLISAGENEPSRWTCSSTLGSEEMAVRVARERRRRVRRVWRTVREEKAAMTDIERADIARLKKRNRG